VRVGIDLEQFARDPYGSGIQRVLQQLALNWPTGDIEADFIFPDGDLFALLSPEQAAKIVSIPFGEQEAGSDLRELVRVAIAHAQGPRVRGADLLSLYTSWLLPEVSYLPQVLERFRIFHASMITVMVGFDALPMTEPANYRFPAGMVPYVSDYFRQLAQADRVVCISDYAREELWHALRRPMHLFTEVAHPGGDHVPVQAPRDSQGPVRFIRLGTLEARKMPVEIVNAFLAAGCGNSELLFIGGSSSSDHSINAAISAASETDSRVTWIQGATDTQVHELVAGADVFLALGTEGYGIPVLEAIAARTPVVYGGIQPAASLMQGAGAREHAGLEHVDLVDLFRQYSETGALAELRSELDASRIPTWENFTFSVARACKS
jgi:glycosyltransferase involved in cell wall biosynthesis